MKHIKKLLIFLLTGIVTGISAQNNTNDTVQKKDTALERKLHNIKQTVGNYVAPEKDEDEDSVCYSDRCIFDERLATGLYGFSQFTRETALFLEAPTRWHKKDFLRFGATLIGTAAIMPFDQRITNLTQGNQHYYYSVPVVFGRIYGEWYSIGMVTAIYAGYGILAHNNPAKKIAIELFQAGVYSELMVELLKIGIGRARPYEGLGPFTYHPFTVINTGFQSSPSGHAACAMALCTVMSRHAHSTFLKILAYVPAGFTLFSRVYQNFHWASDEFSGAAIGLSTGTWVVNLHEGRRHKINIPADTK